MRETVCAIHQPNLFPRASTLAKLYTADIWIVLDDVQFNPRDYQHRTRLVQLDDHARQQWLTLPVRKPCGRCSQINQVRLLESVKSRRRLARLPQHYYHRAPHWPDVATVVDCVANRFARTRRLVDVSLASAQAMLELLDWRGTILFSSALNPRPGRSARLADLTRAVGANVYLCGPGGSGYLDEAPFAAHGTTVRYIDTPASLDRLTTRQATGLHLFAALGRHQLRAGLDAARAETAGTTSRTPNAMHS